jgi:hypothetical protein
MLQDRATSWVAGTGPRTASGVINEADAAVGEAFKAIDRTGDRVVIANSTDPGPQAGIGQLVEAIAKQATTPLPEDVLAQARHRARKDIEAAIADLQAGTVHGEQLQAIADFLEHQDKPFPADLDPVLGLAVRTAKSARGSRDLSDVIVLLRQHGTTGIGMVREHSRKMGDRWRSSIEVASWNRTSQALSRIRDNATGTRRKELDRLVQQADYEFNKSRDLHRKKFGRQ